MFVYLIQNEINGKVYVGQTIDDPPIRRWQNHLSAIRTGVHKNPHLTASVLKHGEQKFNFSIIDTADNQHGLDELEHHHIITRKSLDREYGYNLRLGGRTGSLSDETKQILSARRKGKKLPKEWSENIRKSLIGHKRTKGIVWSEEAIEARRLGLSKNLYLLTFPDGTQTKIRNMTQFCREHGLDSGCMSKVARGILKQHKGHTCKILGDD